MSCKVSSRAPTCLAGSCLCATAGDVPRAGTAQAFAYEVRSESAAVYKWETHGDNMSLARTRTSPAASNEHPRVPNRHVGHPMQHALERAPTFPALNLRCLGELSSRNNQGTLIYVLGSRQTRSFSAAFRREAKPEDRSADPEWMEKCMQFCRVPKENVSC